MDDREQQRKIRHRLAVLRDAGEVSGNVAATCHYYGISRTLFYKWRNRFDELGAQSLRDRSTWPHHSPTATTGRWSSGSCICARATASAPRGPRCASSAATMSRSPRRGCGGSCIASASAGCRRTSVTSAAHSARSAARNSDRATGCRSTSSSAPLSTVSRPSGRCQFTATDGCTRLRVLRLCSKADQRTAIAFGDYVAERLPFPIGPAQTDNGDESPDRLRLTRARPRHRPRLHQISRP